MEDDTGGAFEMLCRKIDNMFRTLIGSIALPPSENSASFSPRIEAVDNEKDIRVIAELPGIKENDVEVNLSGGLLTIEGERRRDSGRRNNDSHYGNQSCGKFRLSIRIQEEIELKYIEANFSRGVLNVMLPKSRRAVSKKMKIAAQSA